MTNAHLFPVIVITAMMAFTGFVFGLVYFAALERTVSLFASRRVWLHPLALTLARMGATVAFLGAAARLGAIPLLAAFGGFLLARALALHGAGRTG